MLFLHPGALYRFEIPDDWLHSAGAQVFVPRQDCYRWQDDPLWPVTAVDILRIDLAGGMAPRFDATRMVGVLRAMVQEQPLPALRGAQAPGGRVHLREGLHRLHAALALRFRQVPVVFPPDFDL